MAKMYNAKYSWLRIAFQMTGIKSNLLVAKSMIRTLMNRLIWFRTAAMNSSSRLLGVNRVIQRGQVAAIFTTGIALSGARFDQQIVRAKRDWLSVDIQLNIVTARHCGGNLGAVGGLQCLSYFRNQLAVLLADAWQVRFDAIAHQAGIARNKFDGLDVQFFEYLILMIRQCFRRSIVGRTNQQPGQRLPGADTRLASCSPGKAYRQSL